MDGLRDFSLGTCDRISTGIFYILMTWFEIFPNWPDAAAFAVKQMKNEDEAKELINILIGAKV